jgi:hypothetical protein
VRDLIGVVFGESLGYTDLKGQYLTFSEDEVNKAENITDFCWLLLLLEPTTKPMELTNFSTFWLQNTTFLLKYGKYICTQLFF